MSVSPVVSSVPVGAPPEVRFRHPVRVYWEDTDAGGIVFYGNYLKFMERARTEWLSSLGFEQEGLRQSGEGMFIVADTQLRFIKPARLDDRLSITVAIIDIGRASVAFQQDVWRGDTLLTQGRVRIGWVQPRAAAAHRDSGDDDQEPKEEGRLKPGRIPERILSALRQMPPPASPQQAAPAPQRSIGG